MCGCGKGSKSGGSKSTTQTVRAGTVKPGASTESTAPRTRGQIRGKG